MPSPCAASPLRPHGYRRWLGGAQRARGSFPHLEERHRLLRQEGLQGHRPRRRRSLTKADEDAPAIPDLVGRNVQPELLDSMWCGDMTYIRTGEGWLYLVTVIDLASHRLIGWSMCEKHDASLVIDALMRMSRSSLDFGG